MLQIKNLSAGYGEVQILKNIELELMKGTISVLMGPNGAGKSTLLKSIYNLTNITLGEVIFEGHEITYKQPHTLMDRGIAFVSQGKVNFGSLTVEENLLLGAHTLKGAAQKREQLKKIYIQFPDLEKKKNIHAFSLSGGQQQMLAIGRALMIEPKLLLMDEPSLGLSPKLVSEVFASITQIRDNFKTTILIVEHNIKSLLDCADFGYVVVGGDLDPSDTCANLKNSEIMKKVFVGEFE